MDDMLNRKMDLKRRCQHVQHYISQKTVTFMAIFFQNGVVHPDLQKLCDLFPQVKYSGQSTDIPEGFQPELLLPGKS